MRVAVVTRPKPDKRGEVPLYVRVQHTPDDGKAGTYLVALRVRVHPKHWNAKRREVKASYGPGADDMNRHLAERKAVALAAANAAILAAGRAVPGGVLKEAVEQALHPPAAVGPPAFVPFWRAEIERAHARRGGVSTALAYESAVRNFEATLAAEGVRAGTLTAEKITGTLVRRHAERLSAPAPHGSGHAPGYVAKQLGILRWALGRAAEAGHSGAANALAASKSVRVKGERAERNRLTLAQVREMAVLPLTGRASDARDWFVFATMAGGLRFSDVARLRWASVKRDGDGHPVGLAFQQQKTGGRVSLPLVPEAAAYVSAWEARTGEASPIPSLFVFGMLDEADEADPARLRIAVDRRASLARKYLREICEANGWPVVGTHGARHSLADHMRTSGASLYDVSKVLGHANTRVTESYLRGFDEDTTAAALVRALGGAHDSEASEPPR